MDKNKKILLVDDDIETVDALEDYFKTKGYNVFTALDGEFALDVFRRQRPPLVLLDMKMPAVNGLEVLKIIRKEAPATKVIVITGFEEEYKSQCEELEVDGFFSKPIKINELTKRVEEVLTQIGDTTVYPTQEIEPELKGKVLKAKILCAEKESLPFSISLYRLMQEPGWADFEVKVVNTQEDTTKAVEEFQPDIVLLATELPKSKNESGLFSTGELINAIDDSPRGPKATLAMVEQYIPGASIRDHDNTTSDSYRIRHLRRELIKVCINYNLFIKENGG